MEDEGYAFESEEGEDDAGDYVGETNENSMEFEETAAESHDTNLVEIKAPDDVQKKFNGSYNHDLFRRFGVYGRSINSAEESALFMEKKFKHSFNLFHAYHVSLYFLRFLTNHPDVTFGTIKTALLEMKDAHRQMYSTAERLDIQSSNRQVESRKYVDALKMLLKANDMPLEFSGYEIFDKYFEIPVTPFL